MAGQDAAQAGFVGDDLAVENGVAGELGEPGFGFLSGGARQGRPVVVCAQLGEELAAGEGFFGLDLVAKAGVAGAGRGVGEERCPLDALPKARCARRARPGLDELRRGRHAAAPGRL
ncbi:hypothetical protein [Streptomyces canus]|uniref:hypothetical protein n=1 Tax=Streptomyces canus TaxID=58343 RepID=UPI0037116244